MDRVLLLNAPVEQDDCEDTGDLHLLSASLISPIFSYINCETDFEDVVLTKTSLPFIQLGIAVTEPHNDELRPSHSTEVGMSKVVSSLLLLN